MIGKSLVALCIVATSLVANAGDADDALHWLNRMVTAARQLNFSGTFTYISGERLETVRIAHVAGESGEIERLETLDGSPREVIRREGEVRCVLPKLKTVIIDRQASRRTFPGRLPMSVSTLSEHYRIAKGAESRVAGRTSQIVMLEPRDNLRYGHQLWADAESGLLLKARMVDEGGELIEQFAFNEVQIGGEIDPSLLQARYNAAPDWRILNAHGNDTKAQEIGWQLTDALPGYRLMSSIRREVGVDGHEALHLVYSDGLTSISVFIEPDTGAPHPGSDAKGFLSAGSIGVYARAVDGQRLTVLGEAPREALRRLGDGMTMVPQ